MKNRIIKTFSFFKLIALGLLHVIISPIFLFLPKYENYIFVLTTGRSGSNNFSNLFNKSTYVNAFHEAYPIINNNYTFKNNWLNFWNGFTFYFVKFPKILLSYKKGNKIYFETNHLFLKSFAHAAIKVFGKKTRIIYLVREPYKVAKSIYEIGRIPGTKDGDKWYLNPYKKENCLDFLEVFRAISDENKQEFEDYYKCLWYWYEIDSRAKELINKSNLPTITIQTNELNNPDEIIDRMNLGLDLKILLSEISSNPRTVGKNLKSDEKDEKISNQFAEEKASLFLEAIQQQ